MPPRLNGVLLAPAGRAVLALVAVLMLFAGLRVVTAGGDDTTVASPITKSGSPGPAARASGALAAGTPSASAPSARTSAGPNAGEGEGPRHTERTAPAPAVEDPTSPAKATRELAQDLADLRGRAWSDLDLAAAALLNAPGSSAAKADAAGIRRARADGVRYDGLRFVVRSARARDHADGHRVVLDLRVDVPAYSIESGATPTRRPAATDQRVRLIVHWSGERWQVERVLSA